ncbi:hypothetical protein C8Q78DRAFT_1083619 [Trametes maxima]|nr:hypothetical protein C8Q78DRAFT_1083619 [Trametes maxima]
MLMAIPPFRVWGGVLRITVVLGVQIFVVLGDTDGLPSILGRSGLFFDGLLPHLVVLMALTPQAIYLVVIILLVSPAPPGSVH